MTNTELADKIEALLAKATPGPWEFRRFGVLHGGETLQFANGVGRSQVASFCCQENIEHKQRDTNAELCADLVNNAPAIIEALRKP